MENSRKKVLLIAPNFYNYHNEIIAEMNRQGYDVEFFEERPSRLIYSLTKKLPKKMRNFVFEKYLNSILTKISKMHFDYFLLIRGEIISPYFMESFKKIHPNTTLIMYQWDSVRNNDFLDKCRFFDKVFTFDYEDAKQYNIPYMPLFFLPDYFFQSKETSQPRIDLTFIGGYHGDRYSVLQKLQNYCMAENIIFDFYLYIAFIDYLKLFLTRKKAPLWSDVKFKKIDKKDILDIYKNTHSILDIESNMQTGLTIRTFEVLATGKIFLTTNSYASKLLPDFQKNIIHFDRYNPNFTKNDLQRHSPVDSEIDQYSLKNWIKSDIGHLSNMQAALCILEPS